MFKLFCFIFFLFFVAISDLTRTPYFFEIAIRIAQSLHYQAIGGGGGIHPHQMQPQSQQPVVGHHHQSTHHPHHHNHHHLNQMQLSMDGGWSSFMSMVGPSTSLTAGGSGGASATTSDINKEKQAPENNCKIERRRPI
jgi:hypothetical protein